MYAISVAYPGFPEGCQLLRGDANLFFGHFLQKISLALKPQHHKVIPL